MSGMQINENVDAFKYLSKKYTEASNVYTVIVTVLKKINLPWVAFGDNRKPGNRRNRLKKQSCYMKSAVTV